MKTLAAVLVIALLFQSGITPAGASSAREIKANIDFQVRAIQDREEAVSRALDVALSGSVGEFQKWRDLDREVQNYLSVVDEITNHIDQQVRRLVAEAPGSPLPRIVISDPFSAHIGPAEARIEEIRRAEAEVSQEIGFVEGRISEIEGAMVNATQEAFGELMAGFLPSERSLAGKGTIVLFSAWFGPPGIAAGLLAVGITSVFNQFVGVYYTTSGLADQVKILSDFLRVLRERLEELKEVKQSYQPALREMRAIEQELESFRSEVNGRRRNLENMIERWREMVGEGTEEEKQEAMQEYEQERNELAGQAVSVSRFYYFRGTSRYGSGPLAAPDAGEVARAADGYLRPVLEVYERVISGAAETGEFREAAGNAVSESRVPSPGWWNSEHNRLKKELSRASGADARRRAAAELFRYEQNHVRRWAIHRSVSDGTRKIQGMLDKVRVRAWNQFAFEVEAFEKKISIASQEYHSARRRYYSGAGSMPVHIVINRIERDVARLESRLENAMSGASRSPATPLRWQASLDGLLARIELVEQHHRSAGPPLAEALNDLASARRNAVRELDRFISDNSAFLSEKIVGEMRYWFFPESRVISAWRTMETFRRPLGHELPVEPDFSAWRAEIARHRSSIGRVIGYNINYENLLTVAERRLDGLLTVFGGFPLAQAGRQRVPELVRQKAPVDRLAERLDEAVPERHRHRPGARSAWDAMLIRQRIMTALWSLSNFLPRAFVYDEESGNVTRYNPSEMERLRETWDALVPVVGSFESAARPLRAEALDLAGEIADESESVESEFSDLPEWVSRSLAGPHRAFQRRCQSAETLLSQYAGHFEPVTGTSDFRELENTFDLYEAHRRRVREEAERRRREAEEEERRKREEAAAAEAARERLLGAIEDFYDDFARIYERRDARGIIALIDRGWTAADGSTLADLEETLSNSFRIFDEVSCSISGLRVEPLDENRARVSYNIRIVGRIHRTRIRHEESSAVREIVSFEGGRVRILRTVSGRFWQD